MARTQSGRYGQDATRRQGTLKDQHGRIYSASIDKKSGYPVGPIQPKGWTAPFYVGQDSYKFEDENDVTRFRIDYETLLLDRTKAHEAWAAAYRKEALDRGWDPNDETKRASILHEVGPQPHPVEPIVACMQGNKWILGLTDKVDERLRPFVKQKQDRLQKAIASMDFTDEPMPLEDMEPEDEVDPFEDVLASLEEEADPDALGGKRVPVKPTKKSKAA